MTTAYGVLSDPAIQPLARGLFGIKVGPGALARDIVDAIPWTPRMSLIGKFNVDNTDTRINLQKNPNTLTPMSEEAAVEEKFPIDLGEDSWDIKRYGLAATTVSDTRASNWVDLMTQPASYIARHFAPLAYQHMAIGAGTLLAAPGSYNSGNKLVAQTGLGVVGYDWIAKLQTALQALLDGDVYAYGAPILCYITPELAAAIVKSTQAQASLATPDMRYKQAIDSRGKIGAILSQWLEAPVTAIVAAYKYKNASGTLVNPFGPSSAESLILTNAQSGEVATHFYANTLAASAAPVVGMTADSVPAGAASAFDYLVQQARGLRGVEISGAVRYQMKLSNDKGGYLIQGAL